MVMRYFLIMLGVKNGVLYRHSERIARPLPDKNLIVKWKTFRNKLTPGQQEEWTVTINRPDGKAANAQLMATLYDKSLDELMSHSWSFINFFSLNYTFAEWRSPRYGGIYLSADANLLYYNVDNVVFLKV